VNTLVLAVLVLASCNVGDRSGTSTSAQFIAVETVTGPSEQTRLWILTTSESTISSEFALVDLTGVEPVSNELR